MGIRSILISLIVKVLGLTRTLRVRRRTRIVLLRCVRRFMLFHFVAAAVTRLIDLVNFRIENHRSWWSPTTKFWTFLLLRSVFHFLADFLNCVELTLLLLPLGVTSLCVLFVFESNHFRKSGTMFYLQFYFWVRLVLSGLRFSFRLGIDMIVIWTIRHFYHFEIINKSLDFSLVDLLTLSFFDSEFQLLKFQNSLGN
jgi:hypothetical protein